MKNVELKIRGSNPKRAVAHYELVLQSGQHVKYMKGGKSGTPMENILHGLRDGISALKKPCRIKIVTCTAMKFRKSGEPSGRHKELKQAVLDAAQSKGCELIWDFRLDGSDHLKAEICKRRPKAEAVTSTSGKSIRTDADWEIDHYRFTLPNGNETWIPNGWEVGGPSDELAPF